MIGRVAALSLMLILGACQDPNLASYHADLAHPYKVSEAVVRLPLGGASAEDAAAKARGFAGERPNNGSSFIVSAPTQVASAVRTALIGEGVAAADIRVVPEGDPAEVVRIDRYARVEGCNPPAEVGIAHYLFGMEDGFAHDNSTSALFGCATRRNVVEMTDDPRSLTGAVDGGSRRAGVAGARAYDQWTQGKTPAASITLPTWSTGAAK